MVVLFIFYALVRIDCANSTDNSCYTLEAIDTVRREFKTPASAKAFITIKKKGVQLVVDGKTIINGIDGFIEYKLQ